MSYQLSCESTVDMPYSYIHERGIEVLFYSYCVNGEVYEDDMGRDPSCMPHFYQLIEEGNIPSTSQINEFKYEEFFRKILESGKDVFHICFGSGMTKSYDQALLAKNILEDEFKDRKIIVIDSLCSSSGYGMLVDDIKDLLDEGKSMDEVVKWVNENRNRMHHHFYSTTLKYFKRTGRVSGPVASIGNMLRICPVMRLNSTGHIIADDKAIGKRNAINKIMETMEEHADNGTDYEGKCFISHSNNLHDALLTKSEIEKKFPHMKQEVKIFDIGTIIASHTGPGTIAVFFHGDERKE